MLKSLVLPLMLLLVDPAKALAAPSDVVERPVVLRRGELDAELTLEVAMAIRAGSTPSPQSLAPDLYYGISDDLTVGLVHSSHGLSVIDSGSGLCFAHACGAAYDNFAVDARWRLHAGALSAAARTRLVTTSFDVWKPSLRVGAVGRWHRGRWAIASDPHLSLGLLNHDRGNRAFVNLPVWVAMQPTCRWALHLRTGVRETLATFGDTYQISFGLGATAAATRHVDIAFELAFPRLLGALPRRREVDSWLAVAVRWP